MLNSCTNRRNKMQSEEAIIKWYSTKPGLSHKPGTHRSSAATWPKSPIKTGK